MAKDGVIDFDDHLARDHLRVGKNLRVVIDRPARDVILVEQGEPMATRLPRGDLFNPGGERGPVPNAARVIGKVWLVCPLGTP